MPSLILHNAPSIRHPLPLAVSPLGATSPSHVRFAKPLGEPRPLAFPAAAGARAAAAVKCMANPRRVKMVAKQIRRELSDMLLTDKVLQYAILPEAALGADRYLSSLTTISDVEVSSDLQVVKVYVSVFGDERGREIAIAGLKSKAKYVRSELGRRMKLRLTPEIRFIEDESLERGSRVIAILDKLKAEKKTAKGQDEERVEASDDPQDDGDWEGNDPDGDIIYVE
ncbi:probable ribosome-binding factor A, chloroplastic [Rhodamnia argentea]|uniref:Probable ribosome-binding factor A, chloroplastic n=1 Tax=Rhodamnia argentea TaxID=178133 RepID=A0A8B8PBC2_9MYRT|nr:probable ribosome-binding factor A, chloroplastic [Rhodamnia argentea]XP_048134961.1 probable ribosome-binding factor A, chloroplastic [Rhodamnia argentea]